MVGGVFFWTGVHLTTHFGSFALDGRNTSLTEPKSTAEHFRASLITNLFPTITGLIILTVLVVMTLSSCVGIIRRQMRFIPFHVLHWGGAVAVYLLLVVHGVDYYNPSFWKWLLPIVVFVVLDRFYWIYLTDRFTVSVKNASPYDDVSRVAIVEMDKPSGFKFEVGQYILLRMPWIGECHTPAWPSTYVCVRACKYCLVGATVSYLLLLLSTISSSYFRLFQLASLPHQFWPQGGRKFRQPAYGWLHWA